MAVEVLSLFLVLKLNLPYDGLQIIIDHPSDIFPAVAAVPLQAAFLDRLVARRHAEEGAHGVLHQAALAVAVGEGQRDVVDAPPASAAR